MTRSPIRHATMAAALALAASGSLATAHAAGKLHEHQVMQIAAPPAKVWTIIQNFSDLTWVPAVKSSDATEANTPGSVRTLDLGGPKLMEKLVSYSAAKHSYTYEITADPANMKTLPVSHYRSTITVAPAPGGSKVTWDGTFERADTAAKPADGMDDASATKAVNGVYTSGLANLKTKAEAG